jgi:hypothetical protein
MLLTAIEKKNATDKNKCYQGEIKTQESIKSIVKSYFAQTAKGLLSSVSGYYPRKYQRL